MAESGNISGPPRSVVINNRAFAAMAETEVTLYVTQYSWESEETTINTHKTASLTPKGFSDLELSVSQADFMVLVGLNDAGESVSVTLTMMDGTRWGGQLSLTGDLTMANQKTTIEMRGSQFGPL